MKRFVIVGIITALLLLPVSEAFSDSKRGRRPVTPYGDFCKQCTQYGTCKSRMSHDDSKKAMMDYYHKKGLIVEIENKRGRFIKAKVKDKDEVVDVIIFDRRTGRLRSIY
jgi:hypothetical protein